MLKFFITLHFECNCLLCMLYSQKIFTEIEVLYSFYGNNLIPESLWSEIREFERVLQEKDILIGVLGQHNCGKSTLLNALIGHW